MPISVICQEQTKSLQGFKFDGSRGRVFFGSCMSEIIAHKKEP